MAAEIRHDVLLSESKLGAPPDEAGLTRKVETSHVGGATCRTPPIPRSALEKDPRPGPATAEDAGDTRDMGSIPGLGRSWRRKWQPTPVFLPGKFHRQRSLVGYRKMLDTTEQLSKQ